MRFTSIIVAGALALFASAQDTTSSSTATAATTDAAQASSIACLNACKDGDVACESKCIAVSTSRAGVISEVERVSATCGGKGYLAAVHTAVSALALPQTASPATLASVTVAMPLLDFRSSLHRKDTHRRKHWC